MTENENGRKWLIRSGARTDHNMARAPLGAWPLPETGSLQSSGKICRSESRYSSRRLLPPALPGQPGQISVTQGVDRPKKRPDLTETDLTETDLDRVNLDRCMR